MKNKIFFKIVLIILFYSFSIGFICPYLFSNPSDFSILAGIALIILMVYIFTYYFIKIIKNLKK